MYCKFKVMQVIFYILPKQLDATYNFQFHDIQSKKLF